MENIKRIIIKIGSSSLVNEDKTINNKTFIDLIKVCSNLMSIGKEVAIVTSGAIAVGMGKLDLDKKPKKMGLKQACAALGQASLMNLYEKYSSEYNLLCAQILVNHDDFENRKRMDNLYNTFEELFANKILPIINENDALAVEEIKVGDNDTLSALVASMINCDLLVLCSDINGLYDKNPKEFNDAKKIDVVDVIDKKIDEMIGKVTSNVGTGGMETKIKAARICTKTGCDMAIINSLDISKIEELLKGKTIGTIFKSKNKKMHSKDHWIVYNAYSKGVITVDDGAKKAVNERKSLLSKGIIKVEGKFTENSVVMICDINGDVIAKGIVNYNSNDIISVIGLHSKEMMEKLNSEKEEIVHANSLVLIKGEEYGSVR